MENIEKVLNSLTATLKEVDSLKTLESLTYEKLSMGYVIAKFSDRPSKTICIGDDSILSIIKEVAVVLGK